MEEITPVRIVVSMPNGKFAGVFQVGGHIKYEQEFDSYNEAEKWTRGFDASFPRRTKTSYVVNKR